MSKSRFGYQLYRWHAWAGLFGGVFLLVICATGSVAVFRPEIERAVDWGGFDFEVVPQGKPIAIERAIDVARAKHPGAPVTAANYPALPGSSDSHGPLYSITMNLGRAGGGTKQVLVDPYRAQVVAEGRPTNGWGNWLRQLHVRFLYFGFWGRWIVGFFGIVLLFATVSGLVIFARFNANSWRPRVRRGRGSRIFLADVHKVVGLSSVAFNLVFGVTGAVLGLEGIYHNSIAQKERPVRRTAVAEIAPARIEQCVQTALARIPGTRAAGVDLAPKTGTIRVRVEHGALKLVKEHQSSVTFDAGSGAVVAINDATRNSAGARVFYAMEPLHFGRLGGALWVKLLWGLMGMSGAFLSITGFAIFLLRKRKPRSRTVRAKISVAPGIHEPAFSAESAS